MHVWCAELIYHKKGETNACVVEMIWTYPIEIKTKGMSAWFKDALSRIMQPME